MCIICDTIYVFSQRQRIQLNKEINVDGIVTDAINQLYDDRKINKETQQALFQSHYEPLKQAVNEGYGKSLAQLEYGTPNYEFLKQLQTNTAVFAMFKSHTQQKEMFGLLKDTNGNLRSKEDFKAEALKLDNTYRTTHLDAQYDTAVRTARMAAQWEKFQKNKRLYPNLKYLLTKSSKPDQKHLAYVGIVAPIDGSFWQTHYPPLRWRCQCGVEPTDEETTDIPHDLPPIDKEFAFNSGKEKKIFNVEQSSYAEQIPAKEKASLIKQAAQYVEGQSMATNNYKVDYTSKSGTTVEIHPNAINNSDFKAVEKAAKDLANDKAMKIDTIQILPIVHDPVLRPSILPNVKGNYNPDYRIDGVYFDLKTPSGERVGTRTIKNLLGDAERQAEGAVLIIPDNYVEENTLYDMIGNQFKQVKYKDFQLYLKYNNEWQYFNQEKWLEFYKSIRKK